MVKVGTFAGDTAGRTPPDPGSPGGRSAYRDCAAAAHTFLGDDWRTGRIGLTIDDPKSYEWGAGRRWYVCQLSEVDRASDLPINRTGSLRAALGGPGGLHLGCTQTETDQSGKIVRSAPVDCTARHDAEFVGIVDALGESLTGDQLDAAAVSRCYELIAAYAGVPNDRKLSDRIGYWRTWPDEDTWARGNRSAACYAWDSTPRTGSIKGIGPKGLPAN